MGDCECLPKCAFFHDKMENMPSMSEILKARYCQGDWAECARHQVFARLGREGVPGDLFPNQQDRVADLLSARY